jgi:CRISPR-associated endonuclease Csy4
MQYYIQFEAKPSEEIAPEIIISQVFSFCHNEMVKLNTNEVGVSFPEADNSIGRIMRVHGSEELLVPIAAAFASLADYCKISAVKETPSNTEWRMVKRVQPRSSAAKIRRLVKRGSITQQEADERVSSPSTLSHPYLQLRSASTNQNFRLFITQVPLDNGVGTDASVRFNTYGLGGAVPWF